MRLAKAKLIEAKADVIQIQKLWDQSGIGELTFFGKLKFKLGSLKQL